MVGYVIAEMVILKTKCSPIYSHAFFTRITILYIGYLVILTRISADMFFVPGTNPEERYARPTQANK